MTNEELATMAAQGVNVNIKMNKKWHIRMYKKYLQQLLEEESK